MREIKAIVRRNLAGIVIATLRNEGFLSISISEVEGTGKFTRTPDVLVFNLPASYNKMSKLEIVCRKEDVQKIVEIIHKYGGTGEKGDGLVYISEVIQIYKVRTGQESIEDI
ncbi:MAG: P-II family nitrogen regulator [Bacteroidota bacterium]|nr:P-II family nitrogen regulator [Bacteroidota bacterium]